MSCWTSITAIIYVDTHIQDEDIVNRIYKMLENAPKITGSERDADIFVNVRSGYNIFIGCDCEHCEHKDTIVIHSDNSFDCAADENYECSSKEYQTNVVITIVGELRNRLKFETLKEYNKFINFIKQDCDFDIINDSVNIKS